MENKNENLQSSDTQKWVDELLNESSPSKEIGPDEEAILSAGLTRPEDLELEKILSEDWLKEDTADPEAEEPAEPETTEDEEPTQEIVASAETQFLEEIPALTQEEPVSTTPEQEEAEEELPPKRKIRPKMKKGYGLLGIPHILATVLWLAIIVAIGLSLGRVLWVCCADVMAFGKEPQTTAITITKDDTIDTISQKLSQANLIRYPELFKTFAVITGKDENISEGTFTLDSQLDYNAMINSMVYYGPTREEVDVMFPEGATCAQIFKILEENNVCSVADLENYAANGELSYYWFLEGVPRGDKYSLEGYLAPDTYKFYTNDEPRRVLEKFLNEFDDRFTELMKEDFVTMQQRYADKLLANGFDAAYVEANPLTLHQVVTLASIVQKETSSISECYEIASVFYNRLTNPNIMNFGSDATVFYAIGDYFGEVNDLTEAHLSVDNPYNTRTHNGFPPGPICNMGVHSLYGALEPNDTNYLYFVYDHNKYEHRFSSSYDQHMKNVAELEG